MLGGAMIRMRRRIMIMGGVAIMILICRVIIHGGIGRGLFRVLRTRMAGRKGGVTLRRRRISGAIR